MFEWSWNSRRGLAAGVMLFKPPNVGSGSGIAQLDISEIFEDTIGDRVLLKLILWMV